MRIWALAIVALVVAGCARPDDATATLTPPIETPTPATGTPTLPMVPTVSTPPIVPTPDPFEPQFDGARAYQQVLAQIERGDGTLRYRVPNTTGNDEVAQLITDELMDLGFDVWWHHFNATYGCQTTPMHNVVAQRAGTSGKTVVFAAHYDTRPIADKDPDPEARALPVLGANDGASGVAVLLELARVLPTTHNDTVRFVFFDGEDGGGYLGTRDGKRCTDWILGSRAYAGGLSRDDLDAIRAFVLVDMIGDPDLVIPREGYSRGNDESFAVLRQVYAAADELGHDQFLDTNGPNILDDHVPFIEKNVAAIDLIHTLPNDPKTFPDWHHTVHDDISSVSAESLAAVGETLEAWFHDTDGGLLR